MSKIVTRFPPSPTGMMHIGNTRTAIFNWLLARSQGGIFILRIEDTDAKRSTREATDVILNAMEWLGLDYDEGPYFQAERKDIHLEYVQKLLDAGRAYYCHCTSEELDAQREKALKEGGKPKYNGKCRDKGLGAAPGSVIRFKGPLTGSTGWRDLIKGAIVIDNSELDDLILVRGDGLPTYNLAVVVDDLTMGITHVIRGDDHINNTPRQILLYHALDAEPPEFGHMPLTLGADKTRLSKRHGATSTMAYRDMGYLPEALVNYLVRLGWSYGNEEIFSREELIDKFSLENMGKSAGVFDMEKLNWLNAHYLKEGDPARITELATPFYEAKGYKVDDLDYAWAVTETLQPRAKTLADMADMANFYYQDVAYEPKAAKKFLKGALVPIMEDLSKRLAGLSTFSEEALEDVFKDLIETHEIKLGEIAQPVRVALTGRTASPGLFEIMSILGKELVTDRIQKAAKYMAERAEQASNS
ncbi:MAG: glutamate--tRNA ligase [Deltaproteobacteria bacterium]|nr:glutamate--tRNA ligase [Deltaproteobacteria bacterium]